MSGGQFPVPLVIRMATGAGRQLAAQHSHSFEGWYAHIPGLRIAVPATIDDARGMLAAALAAPDPTLIFEPISLYNMEGELTPAAGAGSPGRRRIRRAGRDLSVITSGASLWKCLEAATALAADGIEAEVIDLRMLRPLDDATLLGSVSRTHRALIVDEGWRSGGIAAEVGLRLVEQCFYELDAPVARVCSAEVPIPYPRHLEEAALPSVAGIVAACKEAGRPCAVNSGCRRWAPTWSTASWSSGTSSQAIRVKRGDVVAAVETDKGVIDLECFEDGVLHRDRRAASGTKVPVGAVLALIRDRGLSDRWGRVLHRCPSEAHTAQRSPAVQGAGEVREIDIAPPPASSRVRLAGRAQACARARRGRSISLRGTGPGGAVELADVEGVANGGPSPRPATLDGRGSGSRGRDARGDRRGDVAFEARDPALLPVAHGRGLHRGDDWLAAHNAIGASDRAVALRGTLLVKADCARLRATPGFNGFYRDDRYEESRGAPRRRHRAARRRARGTGDPQWTRPTSRSTSADATISARSSTRRVPGGCAASEFASPTITVTSLGDASVDDGASRSSSRRRSRSWAPARCRPRALGGGRRRRAAAAADPVARRRSPRQRRAARRAVPGAYCVSDSSIPARCEDP
jgi:hypothetical protein